MSPMLEKLFRQESERKFYQRISDEHVLADGYSGEALVAEQSYFEIRLTEMYLHNRKRIWRGYIPIGLAVTDFLYDRRREQVPFFVGNQILKNIDNYLDGRFVEYRNTKVAGPIPYSGGDIGLFVGLFRVEVHNLVKGLFSLLDSLATTFDIAQISRYLKIAKPLGEELLPLLGMEEVGQSFGIRDELSGESLRAGYLVYGSRAQDGAVPTSLWIDKGKRLMHGPSPLELKEVEGFDYCVISIKHRSERDDLASLSFYASWLAAKKYLVEGQMDKATDSFLAMIRELALSADLTEKHRHELILLYKTKFECQKEILGGTVASHVAASRGSTTARDPGFSLQRAARHAEKAGLAENVWQGLMMLSASWQDIPALDLTAPDKDKAVLHEQIEAIRKISPVTKPDPAALARAITAVAYREF